MKLRSLVSLASLAVTAVACNVSSTTTPSAGRGDCLNGERGLVLVMSDYQSSNVALASEQGETSTPSFLSSGSSKPGLALALSGDVVVPTDRPRSGRVVLLDRLGRNVLTWASAEDCSVLGQLAVGTGFESNPQDYVEIDETRALVSRYGKNPTPGAEANDQGDDLLVLDTANFAITGRIALPTEGDVPARPAGMTRVGDHVYVTLQRLSENFDRAQDGAVVGVDVATQAVDFTVTFPGVQNCGTPAASPSGKVVAVACSGLYDAATDAFDATKSDVVLLDATTIPPTEVGRLALPTALGVAVMPDVAFAREGTLLVKAYAGGGVAGERLVAVDLGSKATTELHRSQKPYALGDLRCLPGRGDTCFLADTEANVLRRWSYAAAEAQALEARAVETSIGLPVRHVGAY